MSLPNQRRCSIRSCCSRRPLLSRHTMMTCVTPACLHAQRPRLTRAAARLESRMCLRSSPSTFARQPVPGGRPPLTLPPMLPSLPRWRVCMYDQRAVQAQALAALALADGSGKFLSVLLWDVCERLLSVWQSGCLRWASLGGGSGTQLSPATSTRVLRRETNGSDRQDPNGCTLHVGRRAAQSVCATMPLTCAHGPPSSSGPHPALKRRQAATPRLRFANNDKETTNTSLCMR